MFFQLYKNHCPLRLLLINTNANLLYPDCAYIWNGIFILILVKPRNKFTKLQALSPSRSSGGFTHISTEKMELRAKKENTFLDAKAISIQISTHRCNMQMSAQFLIPSLWCSKRRTKTCFEAKQFLLIDRVCTGMPSATHFVNRYWNSINVEWSIRFTQLSSTSQIEFDTGAFSVHMTRLHRLDENLGLTR